MKIVGSPVRIPKVKNLIICGLKMKRLKADLVDEHFYRPESWFWHKVHATDNYDRKGPKVFAGEYACHEKGKNGIITMLLCSKLALHDRAGTQCRCRTHGYLCSSFLLT